MTLHPPCLEHQLQALGLQRMRQLCLPFTLHGLQQRLDVAHLTRLLLRASRERDQRLRLLRVFVLHLQTQRAGVGKHCACFVFSSCTCRPNGSHQY